MAPRLVEAYFERKLLQRMDLKIYGLMPAHHLYQQHPTTSDELPNRIASGTIIVKPNLQKCIGDKICVFEDGTAVNDIDAVILSTGYQYGFPYVEPGLIPVQNNRVELYKYMYAPNLERPETLVVIGLVQPVGATFPISEMHSRIFCEYIQRKPNRTLPNRQEMLQDIRGKLDNMKRSYVDSSRHTIQVAYVPYMQELASMIDVQPLPWFTYLLQGDPKLAWALLIGPCLAYEFRLRGPHPWKGARDAIANVWDRVKAPTMTRKPPAHVCGKDRNPGFSCYSKEKFSVIMAISMILMVILFVIYAF